MFKENCLVLFTVLYIVVALPTETGQGDSGVITRGVFSTHAKLKTECPDHARIPSLRVGRKCFYIVNSFMAEWHTALRFCRVNGLKFAKVSSKQENDAIVKQIRDMEHISYIEPIKEKNEELLFGIYFILKSRPIISLITYLSEESGYKIQEYNFDLGLGNNSFWLSGTDLGSEGSFYWFEDEQPVFFSAWASGQPDNFKSPELKNDGEHCMELRHVRNLQWNDYLCYRKQMFICELK